MELVLAIGVSLVIAIKRELKDIKLNKILNELGKGAAYATRR